MVGAMFMLLLWSVTNGAWAQSQQTATATRQVFEGTTTTPSSQNLINRQQLQQLPALQQIAQQAGIFVSREANAQGEKLQPADDPASKSKLEQLALRYQQEQLAQKAVLKNRPDLRLVPRVENQLITAEFKRLVPGRAPEYYFAYNLQGAQTISTDKVWPNGLLGLNLAGQQMTVGEWDGGAVRVSHETFGGRATQMDGATTLSDHATHVAGTLIGEASAINPNVRGMAYMANLAAYDWNSDEAEMAQAAAGGMLVSNHSYGLISGWAFGDFGGFGSNAWYWFGDAADTIDAGYGRYSDQSSRWDSIANLAPSYLIVKAAGNDRGYGPPANVDTHRVWNGSAWAISTTRRQRAGGSTGYDCISHAGVAKNVLTVGAVEGITGGWLQPSQVVGSSFHGWGPTDDGRVKPDIVAKGVGVISASSTGNAAYVSKSGTSMASPTVSGSLILLQQHYRSLNQNVPMRSALLKALVIHTADEAGTSEGPDYKFGWGLMNTAKATQVISNQQQNQMVTGVLMQGAVRTYTVYTDGTQPLKATIAWNDPARTATPYVLNGSTKALVNDLDIRIVRQSDSVATLPWTLAGMSNPGAGATRADNDRDNVEQVLLNNPAPGFYEVRVSHKGSLTGNQQTFGLVISGRSQQQVMRQVTFRVDMTGTTVSPLGVRIAGNFQGWDPAATLMTNTAGNIWEYTASLPEGDTVQYKFVNGNAWGQDENALPQACVFPGTTNRWVVVPASNTVLPAFLYHQCVPASTGPVAVTFRVDMTGLSVSGSGVHIAGSFQGWDPSTTPMTLVANNIWEYTTNLLPGTSVEYKFVNGTTWAEAENSIPISCNASGGPAGNRILVVPSVATTLPAVLFNQCGTSVPATVAVTFRVDMRAQVVRAPGPHIAGSFQGWMPVPMQAEPQQPGFYSFTAQVNVGDVIEWKFINGDSWGFFDTISQTFIDYSEVVPQACRAVAGPNRVFTVPNAATTLPVFIFGSCNTAQNVPLVVTFGNGIPAGWSQSGGSIVAGSVVPNASAVFEYRGTATTPPNTVGSRGAYSGAQLPIQSPTRENGFVIFDSDFLDNNGVVGAFGTGSVPSPHYAELVSPVMDLSAVSAPILQFNQFYRKFAGENGNPSATFVVFSRNGGATWPDTIALNTLLPTNAATPANDQLRLFVSAQLGGAAQARMKFVFWGDYYFWMLDDISIEAAPAVDIAAFAPVVKTNQISGTQYAMVPKHLQQGTTFEVGLRNQGGNTINGLMAVSAVQENGNTVFSQSSSVTGSLAFGQTATATFSDPFTTNQPGLYFAVMGAAPITGDAVPTNDLVQAPFFITDTVYAIDRGQFATFGFLSTNSFPNNGSRDGMHFATRYDVPLPAIRASSVTALLAPGSTAGTELMVHIYNSNNLAVSLVSSGFYTVTAADIQNGSITVGIPSTMLMQGSYYVSVEAFTNNGASVLNIRDDVSFLQPLDASLIYLPTPGNWFNNGNAFAIRLNGSAPSTQPQMVNVTFRVNMSRYPVDSMGVYLAGSFQGWNPSTTPLTQTSTGMWEVQLQVPANQPIEYKFINGNSWGRDEQNWLIGCGTGNGFGSDNRLAAIGSRDTILPLVFFNSCATTLQELTIADVQVVPDYLWTAPVDASRRSRYNGQVVTVEGVVAGGFQQSALSANFKSVYLQMQVPMPPWMQNYAPRNTGVNVRLLSAGLADTNLLVPGNRVRITGLVNEFPTTNALNSETQIDINVAGNIIVLATNDTAKIYKSEFWDFTNLNNNQPVQNPWGENYEGTYLRFENLIVTQVNQFAPGRFDLTLKDRFDNILRTRDASRVMRAPLFSTTDSTAAVYVRVGDTINVQGFMVEVITAGVPEFRIAPWYATDIEKAISQAPPCTATIQPLGPTSLCMGEQVELQVNGNGAIMDVSWTIDNVPYPDGNGLTSIFARTPGDYQATVTFVSGCVLTTNVVGIQVTVPHQAFVQANGPLHYAQGQNINTSFNAVPQQQLSLVENGMTLVNYAFRTVSPQNGWTNVPQGAAANFSGLVAMPADSLACGALPAGSLQGKVALLYRGACAISDKALNAQRAGAIAVVVVNSFANATIPTFVTNPLTGDSVTIPVVIITLEEGRKLRNRVVSGTSTLLNYQPSPNAQYFYQWFRNDQPENGGNGPSYTATRTGDYFLEVSTGGSCVFRSPYFPVSQTEFTQTPWVLQNLNQPIADITVRNIAPIDANTAWTLEERGEGINFNIWYYRTTNGGANWQAAQIPGTAGLGTSHIHAVDAQTAFVTLYGDSARQGVYRTTDGGNSWMRLPVFNQGGFPNATYFWNAQTGVVLGDPINGMWQIYRTNDGGNSWNLTSNIVPALQGEFGLTSEASANQAGELVWASSMGRFFSTNDQGQTWQVRLLPEGGQARMAWGENGLGVVYFIGSATLHYTENGGASWLPMQRAYGGVGTVTSLSMVPGANPQSVVISGPLGTAYVTHNVGWGSIDGIFHSAVKFISPTVGWSGGISAANGQGGIYKWNSNHFGSTPQVGSISGQLRYANASQSPLSGSFVAAYNAQTGNLEEVVSTQPNGQFNIPNLPEGQYVLRAGTQRMVGGVNATDALRVARHFTGLAPLNGLSLEAADVNANGNINATDALQVAQRFTGLLNNPSPLRIYFDARGGNLDSVASVHMHSGASVDPNQVWQYVVGNWGSPSSPGQMTADGPGKWMMGMNPNAYYSQAPNGPLPAGSVIDNIGMVFRESGPCTNCREQKDGNGQDIFIYPAMMNPPVSTWLGVKATQSGMDGFGAGNWLFSGAQAQVTANNTASVVLHGLVAGDVDGSFNPSQNRMQPKVNLLAEGDAVQQGRLVRLPIRIQEGGQLGAISLVLRYNAKRMQPLRMVLADASKQAAAQLKITDEEIRLSWFDLAGWSVTGGEQIMELELLLQHGTVADLGIEVDAESEFADVVANPLSRTILLMPGVVTHTIAASADALSLRNYPNPFAGETTLSFSLPENAQVQLRVMDARGREVLMLPLGDRPAGDNSYALQAHALQAGVYFCEVVAKGDQMTEKALIRLVVK